MDKITRVLMLYQSLMKGEIVYKASYSVDFDVSERSFDRDIQDIRLFLSDSFSGLELVYDEKQRGYYIKNLAVKREIAIGECYILTKLLLDSRPLRTDDQSEIVKIMLPQLSIQSRKRVLPVLQHTPTPPERLDKASVKLVEDLLYSIERKDKILIQFGTEYHSVSCIPYSVEFRDRSAFLVAWSLECHQAQLYILDDILSYTPSNCTQYLKEDEIAQLQELIALIYHSEPSAYQSFLYEKEIET